VRVHIAYQHDTQERESIVGIRISKETGCILIFWHVFDVENPDIGRFQSKNSVASPPLAFDVTLSFDRGILLVVSRPLFSHPD